jgi:hypothetical protein
MLRCFVLAILFISCSDNVHSQCWTVQTFPCSTLYPASSCSGQTCSDDVCPPGTDDSSPTGYSINMGVSATSGFYGTYISGSSSNPCTMSRPCAGCVIVEGVNVCKSSEDPNGYDHSDYRYNEAPFGYGCPYF